MHLKGYEESNAKLRFILKMMNHLRQISGSRLERELGSQCWYYIWGKKQKIKDKKMASAATLFWTYSLEDILITGPHAF